MQREVDSFTSMCKEHTSRFNKVGLELVRQLNRKRHFAAKPDNWIQALGTQMCKEKTDSCKHTHTTPHHPTH